MQTSPVFTRYLYLKDEADVALLASLFHKDKDQALFWAYELHYSGFTDYVFHILWRIYFEFYATLNPSFEAYFKAKQKDTKNYPVHILIALIINNLIIRKFNTDVFLLREVACNFQMEPDEMPSLENSFMSQNYEAIASYIMETNDIDVLTVIANAANSYFAKPIKKWDIPCINPKIGLLTRIMQTYTQLNKKGCIGGLGKSLYVITEPEDIIMYANIETSGSPRTVLPIAVKYSADMYGFLHMFKKKRGCDIMENYRCNWLFYASESPIWLERIEAYNGTVNKELKIIAFEDAEEEESFYDKYGYSPDEQSQTIQERNIPPIKTEKTWSDFYKTYKGQGLYCPDQAYLDDL